MKILNTFIEKDSHCIYLPDRPSALEYQVIREMSPEEYEDAMNQGYRKFGPLLFHTVCSSCQECQSLRIPVEEFRPNRSQRRALDRNSDLIVQFNPPTVDSARLELYKRYHAAQSERKGWPVMVHTKETYSFAFVFNPVPSLEISIWEGETLRGIVITDITPGVVSGVYHYHDPDLSDRSLGTFAILQTLELARRLKKPWVYFGYYVKDCPSLSYKSRFRPCELLGADRIWRPFID